MENWQDHQQLNSAQHGLRVHLLQSKVFFQGSTNERGKAIFSSSFLIMSSTLRVMPRLIYNPSYGPDYLLLQVWLYTIWTKYQFLNNKVEEYDILR